MRHVKASKMLHHLAWNDPGDSCSEKKKCNFPAKMAKKGRTMIQGQNQFKFFSAIGNGKQIS